MALRFSLPLVLAAALVGGAARAAESGPGPLSPEWLVTVQFGPGLVSAYPGAAAYRPVPVPGIAIRRADEPERFSAPDDGFGAPILDAGGFHAGPVANVLIPRWRTHPELRGLRKLRTAVEVGGFAEYFVGDHIRLRGELRQGVYGHHGLVSTLGADFIAGLGPLLVSAGPRLNLATRDYVHAYYDVAPDQALQNGRVFAFRGEGGVTSAGLMATARYDFAPNWNATAYGGLQRLTGSAGASPIPNLVGSRNQFLAGLLFARTFAIRGF